MFPIRMFYSDMLFESSHILKMFQEKMLPLFSGMESTFSSLWEIDHCSGSPMDPIWIRWSFQIGVSHFMQTLTFILH